MKEQAQKKIIENRQVGFIFLLIFSGLAYLSLLFFNSDPIFAFLVVITAASFFFAFLNNKYGLLLLIIIRPILDFSLSKSFISLNDLSLNFVSLFAVLIIIFCGFVILKNLEKFKHLPLLLPWGVFLGLTALSLLVSIERTGSLIELVRLLSIVMMFGAAYCLVNNNKDLSLLIKAVISSALIPALLAIYQFATGTGITLAEEGIYNRSYGTFSHPNILAFYLLVPLSLCLLVFLISNKRKTSILWQGFLALTFFLAMVSTYTRGAWMGFLLVVSVLGLVRYRVFLVIAGIILVVAYFTAEPVQNRLNEITRINPYGSIQWRFDLWQDSFGYGLNRPILGYGAGAADEVILKNRGERFGSVQPHNDYLKIFLEEGLLGLIAYVLLIISLLSRLWKQYRKSNQPNMKILTFLILILCLSIFVTSAGDNVIRNTSMQWALWALLGGLFATQKLKKA
jgi:O-antigen ligase